MFVKKDGMSGFVNLDNVLVLWSYADGTVFARLIDGFETPIAQYQTKQEADRAIEELLKKSTDVVSMQRGISLNSEQKHQNGYHGKKNKCHGGS